MHNLLGALGLDFLIQFLGYILAVTFRTEKFFDLTGSLTFILLTQLSLRWGSVMSQRKLMLSSMVTVWALRLGLFLFYRVMKDGGDHRFDKVKHKPVVFLIYWMVQGVWIFLTLFPLLLVNDNTRQAPLTTRDYAGCFIWLFGFMFEVIADYQKSSFRGNPANNGKFIDSGLWSISRHPNYFGEIVLWVGVFIIASNTLTGWKWVSIASPLFLYYLLNYVSGVPMLERGSLKRYGGMESYQKYIKTVPVLVPFFGKP